MPSEDPSGSTPRPPTPTAPHAPEFWSKRQAAEHTGLSERTIHNYVLKGELTAYRVGPRAVRFLRSDVEALFTRVEVAR